MGGVAGLADPLVAFELAVFLVTAPAAGRVIGVFSLEYHVFSFFGRPMGPEFG